MQFLISELGSLQNAFLGDYDSFTIIRHNISTRNIVYLTKLALLVFDKIVLPGAFFWQSREMEDAIPFFHRLITEGYVLPAIRGRSSTRDIRDYFEHRREEGEKTGNLYIRSLPEVASEIAKETNRVTAEEIRQLGTVVYTDLGSVRESFVNNWYLDILHSQDIYSIQSLLLHNVASDDDRKVLSSKLAEVGKDPVFSRATCIETICSLFKQSDLRESLISRTSWLYLTANAETYNCKFFCSRDPNNSLIFEENLLLLQNTLRIVGITPELLNALSIDELISIKKSIAHQQFIHIYQNLLRQAYQEQQDIIEYLTNAMRNEIKKGKWWHFLNGKLVAVQLISVSVFLGLIANMFSGNDINIPVTITTGSTALTSHILRKLDLFSTTDALKMWEFSDFIFNLKKNYKDTIYKSIGGL